MTTIKIFLFTILVVAFYNYVGQMVPQKITYPPASSEIAENLTPVELAAIGEEIVAGKGTCLTCHTIGDNSEGLRFPDLAGIATRAATRVEGQSAVEYIAESLYDPNTYIVEGFVAGMPAIGKPPIGLTDGEILAVIAYLESLGGEPSVTPATKLEWQGQSVAPTATGAVAPAAEARDGATIFGASLCNTCHKVDAPGPLVGPSLFDVGARMSKSALYEAILDPDATVAEGFSPGIMSATLNSIGFTESLSSTELKNLVDYLASLQGG